MKVYMLFFHLLKVFYFFFSELYILSVDKVRKGGFTLSDVKLKCISFVVNNFFYRLVEFNYADMEAEDQVVAGDAVISDDEEVTLFVCLKCQFYQFIARNVKNI